MKADAYLALFFNSLCEKFCSCRSCQAGLTSLFLILVRYQIFGFTQISASTLNALGLSAMLSMRYGLSGSAGRIFSSFDICDPGSLISPKTMAPVEHPTWQAVLMSPSLTRLL